MASRKIALILLLILFPLTGLSLRQSLHVQDESEKTAEEREVLYLPNGDGLELLSFGYRNVFSNVLWFKTISYFGKHFKTDHDYRWLGHMCNLVIDLDPHAEHVIKFCATMLAWEANDPDASLEVLSKAIRENPDHWMYYYLRGFTFLFFAKDENKAQRDFLVGSKLPNSHIILKRLAAKKLALSDPNTAVSFLTEMINEAEDESQISALRARLKEAVFERDASTLDKAVGIFEAREGRAVKELGELEVVGIIPKGSLIDPFGGTYVWSVERKQVESSTGKKRMSFKTNAEESPFKRGLHD